jgi:NitT/TauT family transport system ATP-binding protein
MNVNDSMAPERGLSDAQTVIDIKDLSLVFETNDGPVHALSNINLAIQRGEFVSFIGPSGCGKTTLMRVVADLEQPTSGSVTVNGKTPANARLDRSYGYVFQAAALFPWRTIEDNISLPLEIMGYSRAERQERIEKNQSDRLWQKVPMAAFRRHAAARFHCTCAVV